jgi:hypothetical protein
VSEWWAGLPDAETQVGCGGETHTLRWHAGELLAVDHEDTEGERALAALGGERCTCVDVLDAWARHADDVRVLTLSSRGPGDQLAVQVDWSGSRRGGRRRGVAIAGRSSGWTAYGPGGPGVGGWEDAEDELVPLLGLGGGLAERLVASVAAAWTSTDRSGEEVAAARARMTAALYGRVVSALRGWLGEPYLDVELEMSEQDKSVEPHPPGRRTDPSRAAVCVAFGSLVSRRRVNRWPALSERHHRRRRRRLDSRDARA